jgi:hypothetical protein
MAHHALNETGEQPKATSRETRSMTLIHWEKTSGCSLNTEVAKTEQFGDVGYIYQDGCRWTAVEICEDGTEMDTAHCTKEKAKEAMMQCDTLQGN